MDGTANFSLSGIQEPVSCLTHLAAVPVFIVLGWMLVQKGRGKSGHAASLAVMALSTVFLLTMSALYHSLGPGEGRDMMLRLDVAGIFTLIAGTATPVHTILFRGVTRWAPLGMIWAVAAAGITLRAIFAHKLPSEVGIGIFMMMGWSGVISCVALWRRFGFAFVRPLLWGGVAYTLGALILDWNWPVLMPGVIRGHELWHMAVLMGLGLHWKFVFQFADGPPDRQFE